MFALTTTLLQRFGNDGQPLIPATILRGEHTKLDEEVYDVTAFTQFVLYSFFFIIILQIIGILLADKAPIQVIFWNRIKCHKKLSKIPISLYPEILIWNKASCISDRKSEILSADQYKFFLSVKVNCWEIFEEFWWEKQLSKLRLENNFVYCANDQFIFFFP